MHPVPPRHSSRSLKMMAIVQRLQQIMVNENLTPAELVGCAEIVRDNYGRMYEIANTKIEAFTPAKGPTTPPPSRP
ncbi:hypothetical protein OVA10_09885 [Lelliottia sp. SL45]|uniref:hypothetical protein n=1 Tax=Lelliottia sp. SL45 TaxID=2994665 RepID=UPI00227558CB|nr:hypothetical protein [Lelliottia sp. SL45]MCY1698359.1 hypothetical protein [Lelliottia sp. SL45]